LHRQAALSVVYHVKALREVGTDDGKGSMLESIYVGPESSGEDCILDAPSFQGIKFLRQSVIFNGAGHQAFRKEYLQQPIEITLEQDNEPEFLNIDIAYLLLEEKQYTIHPSVKGKAISDDKVQLPDLNSR
jgi:hypothetical protein